MINNEEKGLVGEGREVIVKKTMIQILQTNRG